VPTRFFSENAVIDSFARALTSTTGLCFVLGLLGVVVHVAVAPKRSRQG
jgi:hypothetical protein